MSRACLAASGRHDRGEQCWHVPTATQRSRGEADDSDRRARPPTAAGRPCRCSTSMRPGQALCARMLRTSASALHSSAAGPVNRGHARQIKRSDRWSSAESRRGPDDIHMSFPLCALSFKGTSSCRHTSSSAVNGHELDRDLDSSRQRRTARGGPRTGRAGPPEDSRLSRLGCVRDPIEGRESSSGSGARVHRSDFIPDASMPFVDELPEFNRVPLETLLNKIARNVSKSVPTSVGCQKRAENVRGGCADKRCNSCIW